MKSNITCWFIIVFLFQKISLSHFNLQVSNIVEADPEVLCDERVQCAVEGRFCDSAISVRQAALELVGRHIASHPDVGLKVRKIKLPHNFLR